MKRDGREGEGGKEEVKERQKEKGSGPGGPPGDSTKRIIWH